MMIKRLLLIGFCSFAFSGCQSSNEKTQAYLTKGIEYYKLGDNKKARIELKNAIQIDNKKSEAFYYLALIDDKEQNWANMFANLQRTITLNPKNNDAHLKLGQLLLLQRPTDFNKVIEQVDIILKNTANNPGALTLKAAVLAEQKKSDEAIELVDTILKNNPNFFEASNLKAAIYLSKNDIPTALKIIEKSLVTNPDNIELYVLKLRIHAQAKNNLAIEQDYAELIKHFPSKLEFNYALAQYYANNRQDDKVVSTLQNTIKNNPTELKPKLVFIDYLIGKNFSQVEVTIKSYLSQHINEPELLFRLANIYLQAKKYTEAKQQLNIIITEKSDSKEALTAKLLLARVSILEDKNPQHEVALAIIKEVLAINPVHFDALMLKARINLSNKLYDEASSQLRNILNNYPKSDEALVLLAQIYNEQKSPELAEETLHKALKLNPNNFNAMMPILNKLMKNKDFIRATELVEKGLATRPNDVQLLKASAQIKLFSGDLAGIQKIADILAEQPGQVGFSDFLKGKILENQHKYEQAVIQYKQALTSEPGLLDALQGIVQSNEALKQRSATFAYLDSYIKTNPNNPMLFLIKAQLLAEDKQLENAIKILTDATIKWSKLPVFYMELAKLYLQSEKQEQAMAIYNTAIANMPENIDFKIGLADIYEQKGDYASALKLYEDLQIQHPDFEIATNNIVSTLLDYYPTKENIERAAKLAERFAKSDKPYFLDTYAWSLLKSGRYDEALQTLQKVIAKTNNVPVFRYHLGVAYHKTNHDVAAISELEQALTLSEQTGNFSEKKQTEDLLKELKASKK